MTSSRTVATFAILTIAAGVLLGGTVTGAAGRGPAWNLYFGDLHAHTKFSDGWDGTPEDAYIAARTAGADYFPTTDHNFLLTQDEWTLTRQMADAQTSNRFVAIAASEYWIANGFGEVIVFNVEELRNQANWRDPRLSLSRQEVIQDFYDWLAGQAGAIGHWPHPGIYGDLDELEHWTAFRDQAMSSIEIHNYGSWVGAPASWGVHDYESWYLMALEKGWHVMPAAVSDTHNTDWITGSPVRTVLLATSLTRDNLYDAMRSNRGYATLDENLRITYTLNGEIMGSILSPEVGSYTAAISIKDPDGIASDNITLVEIVSDHGEVVASLPASGTVVDWSVALRSTTSRYYYVRVTTASDVSGGPGVTAWTAPVWTGR